MSFVLYGSSLRCRSVLNLRVSSSSMWTSLRDAESRADKEHRSCLGRKSFRCWAINWFREVIDLSISAACFCLWRPEWWHTDNVKKKKRSGSRSLRFSLSTRLSNYAAFFLVEKKEKKKEEGQRENLPAAEKTDICAFWYKPFGLHFVSSIWVWKPFFSFGGRNLRAQSNKWRIDVAFSSRCTSRRHFGVVARRPSGEGTSLLEGIFPLNWPIRARLFLLAPRPKSRRRHINKGWAWFEATWPAAWVRELWPRSIEASICLLDCRLAKIGNPGRRKGSAAPTSEALVRRKGRFSKRGYAGRVQALKAAAQRKHDQDEQQRRSEDAVDAHQGENSASGTVVEEFQFSRRYAVDLDLVSKSLQWTNTHCK